ncbi:HBS1-like protein isoform X2 [Apis laboriosa]|uniref:HBS1-like protein isoform X2 n=1 Tax=Apis laboriosa TaxID=183418 RepID=UPI001CC35A4F|nr:HBS1-like protein isoform X2 [Apis laboriosa]
MSRHRDIRCMNYSEEYEGYDDVYGHSVEDDYCVSPSAEQFLFDRSKQQNIASFITEPDIVEDNEDNEELPISLNEEDIVLTEIEWAKLMSCMESIKSVIGDTISESEIKKKIIQSKFDTELAIDLILKESSKINDSSIINKNNLELHSDAASIKSHSNSFIIPKLSFNKQENIEGKKSSKSTFQVTTSSNAKIIPAGKRPIVKGFNVGGIENTNVMNLHIESSRSQSPYSDYNSPEIKKKENLLKEKKTISLNVNSPRCQSPISGYQTFDLDSKLKLNEEKIDIMKIYKNKRENSKEQLHLIVVGHVDAGKSTLLGRLLCDLGQVPSRLIHKYQQESKKIGKQSFAYAWVFDETGEERERGITMDIGHSKFETKTKSITLLDAPGHKDFIPNMITGATQADVALLVVDATRGISQLAVIVNKLDTVDWSKERFDEIVSKISIFLKQAGFKDNVIFVPCSGLSGENILTKPKESLFNWYKGPTLVDVIDNFKCPERHINKPFRFSINDIFKGTGSGFCVSGHVETGMVSLGDKILILPRNETAVIKSLQIDEISITNAFAGDQVSLTLSGIDQQNVGIGDIICNPQNPVPVTLCFQAHIVVFTVKVPIIKGLPIVIHQQSLVQPGVITKLIAQLHRTTSEMIKKKPRCLPKNSSAIIEITMQNPICMELYKDIKQLGRVMLRVEGTTIAAGLVTKIK